MNKKPRKPRVCHTLWKQNGEKVPTIMIYSGPVFARIPYSEARRIVDEVHDLCDAYEAEQRTHT